MQNRMEMEWKQNGNGKEKKWTNLLEVKFTGMEQKWKGNGMEILSQQLYKKMVLEVEWNGNGKGMEYKDLGYGMLPWESFDFFANSTGNRSIEFHSIPWNSTFHLKMPTSAAAANGSSW